MYFVRETDVHFFLHGMIGFLTAFIVGYCVSLLFQNQDASSG